MSYNIDSVDTPVLDAWILASDIAELLGDDRLAECNFLEEHEDDQPDLKGRVRLRSLWWYGEGSGRAYDHLVDQVLPRVRGKVDAIFTWEGGDSFTGLRVRNGKVTKMDVKMRLVPCED